MCCSPCWPETQSLCSHGWSGPSASPASNFQVPELQCTLPHLTWARVITSNALSGPRGQLGGASSLPSPCRSEGLNSGVVAGILTPEAVLPALVRIHFILRPFQATFKLKATLLPTLTVAGILGLSHHIQLGAFWAFVKLFWLGRQDEEAGASCLQFWS